MITGSLSHGKEMKDKPLKSGRPVDDDKLPNVASVATEIDLCVTVMSILQIE
jgi:hypothetical protein